jgi:hypothetical protein
MDNFEGYPEWLLSAHQCSEEHPMRRSVFWILDQAAQMDVLPLTDIKATDSERHFLAGRLAAIKDLCSEWESIYNAANNPEKIVDTDPS